MSRNKREGRYRGYAGQHVRTKREHDFFGSMYAKAVMLVRNHRAKS